MGSFIDITGMRFGRLVAINRVPNKGEKRALWRCLCDCGNEKVVSGRNLRTGLTQSCGCLIVDAIHGHKRRSHMTPEYSLWLQLKRRCSDKHYKGYAAYGGKGIRLSPLWNNSFEQFLADIGPKPSPQHVLARKDRNGHFEPGNCQWETHHDLVNRPRKVFIPVTVGGLDFRSISAACRHFGVKKSAVFERVKAGIDLQDAITNPAWSMKPRRSRESYLPHGHPDRVKLKSSADP